MKNLNLGELALKKANRRRIALNLPEVLTDGKGNAVRVNRGGKFLLIKRRKC